MSNDRFVKVYTQGNGLTSNQVIIYVDRATGVNYLYCQSGYAGGLSPLLDGDGKPVVTVVENK